MTNDERAREHTADLVRTRIEPGADPRAGWDEVDPLVSEFHADVQWRKAGCALSECASHPNVHVWLIWKSEPTCPKSFRYVPFDVARWRNPAHREAIARRARAYAALQLGGRR